jgi:hypothetical protein
MSLACQAVVLAKAGHFGRGFLLVDQRRRLVGFGPKDTKPMKKSIFGSGLMFLGATLLVVSLLMSPPKAYSGSLLQDGGSSSPTPAASSNSQPIAQPLAGPMLVDSSGNPVAGIPDGLTLAVNAAYMVTLNVAKSSTAVPSGIQLSPSLGDVSAKLTQGGVYFPVYVPPGTSSSVGTVTVPASLPVAFCSGGAYYNKGTGQCSDGKFPYKIVPLNSLSDPAAQTPTIVCNAPTVPTWNPAMKKWNCIVPTGFKNTLGQ